MDFSKINTKKNVFYLTTENNEFSKYYLSVREKEQRILTDAEVLKLPYINLHEWKFREKSTQRFKNYISSKKNSLKILEVGCGNGWFSNTIASVSEDNQVVGLDVNTDELEQAARVFQKKNLSFVYADLFKTSEYFTNQFDIIVLNGTIQYFENFNNLMTLLKSLLNLNGEIHIIDSPFYKTMDINTAREQTKIYYTKIGVPEMVKNYFHHDEKHITNFDVLYNNKRKIINKIFNKKDSPFSWYRYIKH